MTESMATRTAVRQIERDRAFLATEAQSASEALARFAKDVERGVACGDMTRIADQVQKLLARATRLEAVQEIENLYAAERDGA